MKKISWLLMAICLAVMPALQSCDDDEGYSVGDFTPPLWATVRTMGSAFYLDCDAWGTLWPVNTDLGFYEAVDGSRAIISFNPLWDDYQGFDHAVKLLYLQDVLTKTVETVTPDTEDEYGNDPITIFQGDITVSNDYLNVVFWQNLPVKEKHRISLVRPESDADLVGEDGYLNLELRYNTNGDITGNRDWGVVSYNLSSLKDYVAAGAKGIRLTLNSEKNGEGVEVLFDLKLSGSTPVHTEQVKQATRHIE